jgi:hypothetical protein
MPTAKSLRERSHTRALSRWSGNHVEEVLQRAAFCDGAEWGHRANRLTAKERAVVKAIMEQYRELPSLLSARVVAACAALGRAKGRK